MSISQGKLVLRGGIPIREGLLLPKWPVYDEKELEAVKEVFESGHWCGIPGLS